MFDEAAFQSVRQIFDTVAALDGNGKLMLASAICGVLLAKAALAMIAFFGVKLLWRGTKGAGSLLARAGRWFYAFAQPRYGDTCLAVIEEIETDEEAQWDAKTRELDAGSVRILMPESGRLLLTIHTGSDKDWDVLPDLTASDVAAISAAAWKAVARVKAREAEAHKRQSLTKMGHRDRWDEARQMRSQLG